MFMRFLIRAKPSPQVLLRIPTFDVLDLSSNISEVNFGVRYVWRLPTAGDMQTGALEGELGCHQGKRGYEKRHRWKGSGMFRESAKENGSEQGEPEARYPHAKQRKRGARQRRGRAVIQWGQGG